MRQNFKLKAGINFGFATLLLFCSCSSVLVRNDHNDPWGAYPGLRMDAHFIAHPKQINPDLSGNPTLVWTFAAVDFPFSTAVDTLLLPIDLTMHLPKNSKTTNQSPDTVQKPHHET